jgi:hypothetical protein
MALGLFFEQESGIKKLTYFYINGILSTVILLTKEIYHCE